MTEIHGFAKPGFETVRDTFKGNFDSGADLGASYCVTKDGETVVDLWGGFADAAKTKPWVKDTIINVYSTTKTMTALTALLLADRGLTTANALMAGILPAISRRFRFLARGDRRSSSVPQP